MAGILITGASGFLGRRLVQYYKERDTVWAPDHGTMDMTQRESVTSYIRKASPSIVIHCAAASDVGWCQRNPELSWNMNVEGTEYIAWACREVGAKMIFCSSDQVYFGSDSMEPHREEEQLKPANEYGRQKLEAEKRCLSCDSGNAALRLSWMYDSRRLSEGEHGNFFLTLVENLAQGKACSCPAYDYRGITDVRLVVSHMEEVFHLPGGVYNFGSEQAYSTYDMAVQLFQECGLPLACLEKNDTAFSDKSRNIRMSMEKAGRYGIEFPDTLSRLVMAYREFSQKF